ncbi:MAG TPA: ABC transporter permease [Limnochordales bacterium]
MIALVGVEFLKLRRHLIVYLAALGALVPAAILVMVWFNLKARGFEPTTELLMTQAQLIVLLLEGPAGAAIIGSMLFGREYGDRTLPNLLISGLPRWTWLGAKWVALALVGLAIVAGAWVAAAGVTLLAVGPAAMDWRLALASLGAHLVGGLALYATGAIPVALSLAFRNPMVGAAWGVVTTVTAFFGINSRYSLVLPATTPWVAAQLTLEALHPTPAREESLLASGLTWTGLPAGWTVALACLAVWLVGLVYSTTYVRRADFT